MITYSLQAWLIAVVLIGRNHYSILTLYIIQSVVLAIILYNNNHIIATIIYLTIYGSSLTVLFTLALTVSPTVSYNLYNSKISDFKPFITILLLGLPLIIYKLQYGLPETTLLHNDESIYTSTLLYNNDYTLEFKSGVWDIATPLCALFTSLLVSFINIISH